MSPKTARWISKNIKSTATTCTYIHTYIHTARNKRSAAQQNTARDARVHLIHMSAPQPRGALYIASRERVQQRTANMPRPQMAEEIVKMVGLAPRERVLVSVSGAGAA